MREAMSELVLSTLVASTSAAFDCVFLRVSCWSPLVRRSSLPARLRVLLRLDGARHHQCKATLCCTLSRRHGDHFASILLALRHWQCLWLVSARALLDVRDHRLYCNSVFATLGFSRSRPWSSCRLSSWQGGRARSLAHRVPTAAPLARSLTVLSSVVFRKACAVSEGCAGASLSPHECHERTGRSATRASL